MRNFFYCLFIFSVVSCVPRSFGGDVIIDPIDAVKLCNGHVKSYSAISGNIECKENTK